MIEAEGVRRARAGAAAADLKLMVFDLQDAPAFDPAPLELLDADSIVALNKCDIVTYPERSDVASVRAVSVSAKTGAGMGALLELLSAEVAERLSSVGSAPALTRVRHRRALEECAAALERAAGAQTRELIAPELIAEDLRLARARTGPDHRPGRRGGHPRRGVRRFLYRQIGEVAAAHCFT